MRQDSGVTCRAWVEAAHPARTVAQHDGENKDPDPSQWSHGHTSIRMLFGSSRFLTLGATILPLPIALVEDIEGPKAAAVVQGVRHEIERPGLVGARRAT